MDEAKINFLNKIKKTYSNKVLTENEFLMYVNNKNSNKMLIQEINNDKIIYFVNNSGEYEYIDIFLNTDKSYINHNELISLFLNIKRTKYSKFLGNIQSKLTNSKLQEIMSFYEKNWR